MVKLRCSSSPRISNSEGAEAAASGRAKARVSRIRPMKYQDSKVEARGRCMRSGFGDLGLGVGMRAAPSLHSIDSGKRNQVSNLQCGRSAAEMEARRE